MRALWVIVIGLVATAAVAADGPRTRPKNVLLFTLDTTRADHLGCYGHAPARTAAIDKLAGRGVLFEQARTPAPLTLPAHTTIMTGLLPCQHGVRENGLFRIAPEAPTLAGLLKANGFATAAFVGAFVLDSSYGLDNGFDVYRDVKSKNVSSAFEERPATAVTRDALDWLAARDGEKPFFAWIHYFDAHAPYRSPLEQPGMHPYDAEIALCSEQIQVVLDALGPALLDTLIVVTADHGEGLGEHGEDSHGLFIYDSTMRVPLIFAHQSLTAGRRVAASVGLQDIARTVCAELDVAPDANLGGRSLAAALHGEDLAGSPQYLETYSTYYSYGWSPLMGLVADGDKIIRAPHSELYRLGSDAKEMDNVFGKEAERARALMIELDELLQDHPRHEGCATEIAVTGAARERLQALGYVGGRSRPPLTRTLSLPDPKDKIAMVHQHDVAHQLMRDGRYPQALAIMKELVDQDPSNPQFLSHYGILLKGVGRWQDARTALVSAIAHGEQTATTYFNLGEVQLQLEQDDQAEQSLRLCLAEQPEHIGALLRLAELLVAKGRSDEARTCYQTLLNCWDGEESFRASIKRRLEQLEPSKPADRGS